MLLASSAAAAAAAAARAASHRAPPAAAVAAAGQRRFVRCRSSSSSGSSSAAAAAAATPGAAAAAATAAKWAVGSAAPSASATNALGVSVNSAFDSGNIEIEDIHSADDMRLRIHLDPFCEIDGAAHGQWFHFRVAGAKGTPLTLRIVNAGECSYPSAWGGYLACASYDMEHWERVPTTYDADAGVLTIKHTPARDGVFYAYFPPFTYNRHRLLVSRAQSRHPQAALLVAGESIDGHSLDVLRFGDPPGDDEGEGEGASSKRVVWLVCRQHPGESMAEWWAEGLVERLSDEHDPAVAALLRDAVVYVVPNMNPDGVWRGHLRTNAAGRNLNREWAAPSADESPEVFHVLRMMERTGVDLLIDVHGDEELPHCFIAGMEGVPNWGPRLERLQGALSQALLRASPDFQAVVGYERDAPNAANMSICSNAIAQRFNCCAVTLEMPFKTMPCDGDVLAGSSGGGGGCGGGAGWGLERAKRFGAASLQAVLEVLPLLR